MLKHFLDFLNLETVSETGSHVDADFVLSAESDEGRDGRERAVTAA